MHTMCIILHLIVLHSSAAQYNTVQYCVGDTIDIDIDLRVKVTVGMTLDGWAPGTSILILMIYDF